MTEQYIAGWNQRIVNPNAKLPRNTKANEQFLTGYYDCNTAINAEIARAIAEYRNPVAQNLL